MGGRALQTIPIVPGPGEGGRGGPKLAPLSQLPVLSGSLTWLLPRRANGLPS